MKTKEERLREVIIEFKNSQQLVRDYMKLFTVVHCVLKQGDGLLWTHVNEILRDEVIEETNETIT